MRVPEVNIWWVLILACVVFWVAVGKAVRGEELLMDRHPAGSLAAATPYYKGKPPPSPHYPGRCWCSIHGPRGGCIKWICPPSHKIGTRSSNPNQGPRTPTNTHEASAWRAQATGVNY